MITIDQAIAKKSFLRPDPLTIERGEAPEKIFPKCDHVIEGEYRVGGQEHFYLECQVTHAYPGEDVRHGHVDSVAFSFSFSSHL